MKRTTMVWNGLPPESVKVAVVLVATGAPDLAEALLGRLEECPWPEREVFLVDATRVAAAGVLAKHPDVFVFDGGGEGDPVAAANVGLAAALRHGGFEYVWLLSGSVLPECGALEVLLELLRTRTDAALASSGILGSGHVDCGCDIDIHRQILTPVSVTPDEADSGDVWEVDSVPFASCLVRASVLREVGFLDRLAPRGAMLDWCLRFRRMGHAVLACPTSRVRAVTPVVAGRMPSPAANARDLFYLRHKYASASRCGFLARTVAASGGLLLRGQTAAALAVIRGARDFFRERFGVSHDTGGEEVALPGVVATAWRRRLLAVRDYGAKLPGLLWDFLHGCVAFGRLRGCAAVEQAPEVPRHFGAFRAPTPDGHHDMPAPPQPEDTPTA